MAIRDGYSYQIVFQDTALQGYTTGYSLLDLVTPDTVYIPSLKQSFIVEPLKSIDIPAGNDTIIVNSRKMAVTSPTYTAIYDTLVSRDTVYNGSTKISHGFRAQIFNDPNVVLNNSASGFEYILTEPKPTFTVQRFIAANTGQGAKLNGIVMPFDYDIEFFDQVVGQSVADTLFPPRRVIFFWQGMLRSK